MKVKFNKPATAQQPVVKTQQEMKEQKARKLPIPRYLMVFLLIVILVMAGYFTFIYLTRHKVRTFGLVKASYVGLTSPSRAVVRRVFVKRGEPVKKGQLLCILAPEVSRSDLTAAKTELAGLQKQLMMMKTRGIYANPALMSHLRDMDALNNRLSDLKSKKTALQSAHLNRQSDDQRAIQKTETEIEQQKNRFIEERARLELAEQQSKFEMEKLRYVLVDKQRRVQQLKQLIALDSATQNQLDEAVTQQEIAEVNYQQAMANHRFEHHRLAAYRQAAQRPQLEVLNQQLIELKKQAEHQKQVAAVEIQEIDAQIKAQEQQLAEAKKQLKSLETEAERTKEVDRQQLLTAIAQTKAKIEARNDQSDYKEYRAADDGVVVSNPLPAGTVIENGQNFLTLAMIQNMWVECYLPTNTAQNLDTKAGAKIYTAQHTNGINGQIDAQNTLNEKIPPVLQEKLDYSNGILIRIDVDNPIALVPGDVVRVMMQTK